jgi:hypothetical protein
VSSLSRQCGIFSISQSYRPPRSLMGIAFLLLSLFIYHFTLKFSVMTCNPRNIMTKNEEYTITKRRYNIHLQMIYKDNRMLKSEVLALLLKQKLLYSHHIFVSSGYKYFEIQQILESSPLRLYSCTQHHFNN